MKMNILIFTEKTKLINQLTGYVERNDSEKARQFLHKYFPAIALNFIHDRLVIELSDTLLSVCDFDTNEEKLEYLQDLKTSITTIHQQYHKKKKAAAVNLKRVTLATPKDKSCKNIPAMLRLLDAQDEYNSYIDGYQHERYNAYNWLKHQIIETIANKTHDTLKASDAVFNNT